MKNSDYTEERRQAYEAWQEAENEYYATFSLVGFNGAVARQNAKRRADQLRKEYDDICRQS